MSRAGREPTEDIKRRIVAASQEVGLVVSSARMHKINEASVRVVNVEASPPGWPHKTPVISVMANVPFDGTWPAAVRIFCSASENDPITLREPYMKGREQVAIENLIPELRDTLNEREKVIAAVKLGVQGPFRFETTIWNTVDLLGGSTATPLT